MKDDKFAPVEGVTIENALRYIAAIGEAVRKNILDIPLEGRFFVGALISATLLVESKNIQKHIVSLLSTGQAIGMTREQDAALGDALQQLKECKLKKTAKMKDVTLN